MPRHGFDVFLRKQMRVYVDQHLMSPALFRWLDNSLVPSVEKVKPAPARVVGLFDKPTDFFNLSFSACLAENPGSFPALSSLFSLWRRLTIAVRQTYAPRTLSAHRPGTGVGMLFAWTAITIRF